MPKVFISHSHKNDAFSKRLMKDLQAAGVEVWIDFEDILHGDFVSRINDALRNCEWVVPLFTPESLNSNFVKQEVNVALTLLMSGKILGIIPIIAAPCDFQNIPPMWNNLQRYDATRDYDAALAFLLKPIWNDISSKIFAFSGCSISKSTTSN